MHRRFCSFAASALFIGALAAPAAGALPATGAGALDPTFGNGGKITVDVVPGSDDDSMRHGVVQPDGKLVITSDAPRGSEHYGSIRVARYLDSGAPDPAFGNGGVVTLETDEEAYPGSWGSALGADGRIFVVGQAKSAGFSRCIALALRPDGSPDTSFASAGVFRYPATGGTVSQSCINVAVQPDGKLVILGNANGFSSSFLLRITAAGTLDPTFGSQGVAAVPGTGTQFIYGLSLGPTGAIYLSGGKADSTSPANVFRFTSAGALDASFAGGGVYATAATNAFLHDIKALPDGSAVASGYHSGKHFILKLTPSGVPAADFGVAGVTEIALGKGYSAVSLEIQRDGKILAGLRVSGTNWRFAAARLTANGALDPTYGIGGIVQLALGASDETLSATALGPDGKLWLYGNADLSSSESVLAIARLLPDPVTTDVVEFYNDGLLHYFITADPNEAAAIDAGAAGPGWTRTGLTFKSGGPTKVCRFYGNPDANPATGTRRGPNSHFYTIDTAECAAVKLDAGWRFESYDFNGWPAAAGVCPDGTQAVKRAYNNRFAQNDSNHRYTTSSAVYAQMIGQGWSGEGTVFCAVQ